MSRHVLRALGCLLVFASSAAAQTIPPGRIEIGGGVTQFGHLSLGSVDATLTTAGGSTSRLFATSTALERTTGVGLRAGVRMTRHTEAEAFASFTKPALATTISGDVEATAPVTATEVVKQYVVGGGALWYLPLRFATPRFLPFVGGGVAYLRQLHQADTLAVTGTLYDAGAGAKYLFFTRARGRLRGAGVRADVRVAGRTNGVALNGDRRYGPEISATLFARF
jgi:hypothetical protein